MSQNISNKIIEFRKKKKFSQAKLADLMKVTQPIISRWESGQLPPDKSIPDLARHLGAKEKDFIPDMSLEPNELNQLLKLIPELKPDVQRHLFNLIKTMAETSKK